MDSTESAPLCISTLATETIKGFAKMKRLRLSYASNSPNFDWSVVQEMRLESGCGQYRSNWMMSASSELINQSYDCLHI